MRTPQHGIFALGNSSHAFLEFDSHGGEPADLATTLASLREPRTTIGGVNLVVGFRPELWRALAPDDCPVELESFGKPVVGDDGFTMPATQHDLVLWVSGSSYDVVFDVGREAIAALQPVAALVEEVAGWSYRHDRDLTGFIDGTENPTLAVAADVAIVPDDTAGDGGSVLLLQKWTHDVHAWEALSVAEQQRVMGRTKPDSVELDDRSADSHVARTDQDDVGRVFRRNMPYGTVADHGTIFVGFSAQQRILHHMLRRMAGDGDGPRDALTRYTRPITGSYYFVPSLQSLRTVSDSDD